MLFHLPLSIVGRRCRHRPNPGGTTLRSGQHTLMRIACPLGGPRRTRDGAVLAPLSLDHFVPAKELARLPPVSGYIARKQPDFVTCPEKAPPLGDRPEILAEFEPRAPAVGWLPWRHASGWPRSWRCIGRVRDGIPHRESSSRPLHPNAGFRFGLGRHPIESNG